MKWLLLILFFAWATGLKAQYTKWIIQFTDKHNSPYSLDNPAAYLSPKAIERRARQHISMDSSDLPVNPVYIQQVLALGEISYISQAKWMNQLLIACKDNTVIDAITQLPFVQKTHATGFLQAGHNKIERTTDFVKKITTNSFVHGTSGDTLAYGTNTGQVLIHNGTFLHNKGFTGKNISIAVLDGGFYHFKELAAFDSMRLQNRLLGEIDFVDNDGSVNEDNVHGMYCLSTMAANSPGVMVGTAPHASYWLMRTENTFSEYPEEEHNWVAAAAFADSAGVDMISSSVGYFRFDDPAFNHSYDDYYRNATTVSKGAAMAAKKGLIVTNSAGNEGSSNWKYLLFPADADSVCAVGAVDNNGNIAALSSYGYPGKIKPNIVSVGAGAIVMGTGGIPVSGNGTSFANPNIHGLIACLWQAFPAFDNMTILNAVYQSADRHEQPDNRYGFGIPDMKKAYTLLKQQQNNELFGGEWLFVNPDPFTARIDIKLVAQQEGTITLSLIQENGNTVATLTLAAEAQEVYDTAFSGLDNLPPGAYNVTYADGQTTKMVSTSKKGILPKDWLSVAPVPFKNTLTAYLTAPETGDIQLRLIDAAGKIIESVRQTVVQNNYYIIPFRLPQFLAGGIYFMQYIGNQKKTIKLTR